MSDPLFNQSPVLSADGSTGHDAKWEQWIPPMKSAAFVAKFLAVFGVGLLIALALVPWIQNISGAGRVVVIHPEDREQKIQAPIDGRVTKVWVKEGDKVRVGDPILDIEDNDPMMLERIEQEKNQQGQRVESYQERATNLRERISSLETSMRASIMAASARVHMVEARMKASEEALKASEADLQTQAQNLERHRKLIEEGLVSERDLEVTQLAEARARTARDSAEAMLKAAQLELQAQEQLLLQTKAATDAEIDNALATLRSAETDMASAQTSLIRTESRLARQEAQHMKAPVAGTVLRVMTQPGRGQVKQGDVLIVIIPDSFKRYVELWVDGNDAALMTKGASARIQFEGWPAIQFSGWPQAAVGTFAAKVAFVDPAGDEQGNFRVLLEQASLDKPWPSASYLRQGTRANGFILLNQVRLGYELWRQLNGFPPLMPKEVRDSFNQKKSATKKDSSYEEEQEK